MSGGSPSPPPLADLERTVLGPQWLLGSPHQAASLRRGHSYKDNIGSQGKEKRKPSLVATSPGSPDWEPPLLGRSKSSPVLLDKSKKGDAFSLLKEKSSFDKNFPTLNSKRPSISEKDSAWKSTSPTSNSPSHSLATSPTHSNAALAPPSIILSPPPPLQHAHSDSSLITTASVPAIAGSGATTSAVALQGSSSTRTMTRLDNFPLKKSASLPAKQMMPLAAAAVQNSSVATSSTPKPPASVPISALPPPSSAPAVSAVFTSSSPASNVAFPSGPQAADRSRLEPSPGPLRKASSDPILPLAPPYQEKYSMLKASPSTLSITSPSSSSSSLLSTGSSSSELSARERDRQEFYLKLIRKELVPKQDISQALASLPTALPSSPRSDNGNDFSASSSLASSPRVYSSPSLSSSPRQSYPSTEVLAIANAGVERNAATDRDIVAEGDDEERFLRGLGWKPENEYHIPELTEEEVQEIKQTVAAAGGSSSLSREHT